MEEINYIYLDDEGYKKYKDKTKELKEEFETVSALISKIVLEGRKEDADSNYERLKNTRRNLKQIIADRENKLSKIIIISRIENSNYLDIGDVVRINHKYFDGSEEEETIELTAGENDFSRDIPKISVNKPVGKCIYKKNVGDTVFYEIRGGKVFVTILEKVNVKSLKKVNEDL